MKLLHLQLIRLTLLILSIYILSCGNEDLTEINIHTNQAPIAFAGDDQAISLPTNSIALDGSSSSDPDGVINTWLWKKISGPDTVTIVSATQPETEVKNLIAGVYEIELNITDNGGLTAKDTIQIAVIDPSNPNHAPVANAGSDITLILPLNTTELDGSGSTDEDNNITSYQWSKISGPSTYNITNANAIKAQLTDLVEGDYVFELKVTDALGLRSIDRLMVHVISPNITTCDNSERPQVPVQLIPLGTLSKSRVDIAVASANHKIVFAGGIWTTDCPECWGSSRVDIYDIETYEWSTAELSEGRHGIATTKVGNKLFFAGGANGDGAFDTLFTTVDIYDASNGQWSVANLSQPRAYMAAASVGNKAIFAGGEKNMNYDTSNVVDIYDLTTDTWSSQNLSEARAYLTAVSLKDKVYFAGGQKEDRWYAEPSDRIDVYDYISGGWTTSTLSQPMGSPGAIATGDNIYWTSGCDVEIKNTNTWSSTMANLFSNGESFFNKPNAVVQDDNIIFLRISYGGTDKFDIYNTTTHTWSIGVLPQVVFNTSIISVDNVIYVTGQSAVSAYNILWKLEF